jgi:DNA-directed RNA polymerase specialized sigma24 family protein
MTQSTVTARPGSGSEDRPVSDLPDSRRARFEMLFTRHHDAVLTYLIRRSGSREDAADLVAETFLTAWRRLDVPADEQTCPGCTA